MLFLKIAIAAIGVVFLPLALVRGDETKSEFFERHVRPLFVSKCQSCHNAKEAESGLQFSSRQAILKGGDRGPAVVPGKPQESLLLRAVEYQSEPQMPPKSRLNRQQIAAIRKWIAAGAVWPVTNASPITTGRKRFEPTEEQRKWWAFQSVQDPRPPALSSAWPKNSIDQFIFQKQQQNGLPPAVPADRRTLIRRATLDLTGLPPTPAEVDRFLKDDAPDAFVRVIDRLLESPAYGERWARHWLDVARYTDFYTVAPKNEGAHKLFELFQAWKYRDWVVKSFNADVPFDQFIKYQIAGDLIASPAGEEINVDGLIATTFLTIGNWDHGDASKEKIVSDVVDDQIDTIGKAFLGMTWGCARCHDHKFDPLSQEDYYALAGIFYSTRTIGNLGEKGGHTHINRVPLVAPAELKRRQEQAKQASETYEPSLAIAVQEGGTPGGLFPGIQDVPIHIRGSYTNFGQVVPRRLPAFLAGLHQVAIRSGSGRRELADWVASQKNTLVVRVIVNRVWQWHFGGGLVRTASNLGTLSEPPTHPELLDWLASRFVEDGWSLKKLHRRIMLSATYQQASVTLPEIVKRDPDNRLLTRFQARRLEAEVIRDTMLAAADRLGRNLGGPSNPDPLIPRRSLYVQTTRNHRDNFSSLFDAADPDASVEKRGVSTVSPQALMLLNSGFMQTVSEHLANRLILEVAAGGRQRMDRAYHLLFGRPIRDAEAAVLSALVDVSERQTWADIAHVLLCSNELVTLD